MSIEITMPRLSDTMEQGTVIKWNKSEGDAVSAGEVIADVETDKATMEMPVYDDGTIAKIIAKEGQTVDVGTLIAVLAEEGEDPSDVASKFGDGSASKKSAPKQKSDTKEKSTGAKSQAAEDDESDEPDEPAQRTQKREEKPASKTQVRKRDDASRDEDESADEESGDTKSDGRMRVSPVARRLAEEHEIDLRSLQGSGPSGRIVKRDVLEAIETGAETAAAAAPTAKRREEKELAPAGEKRGVEATPVGAKEEKSLARPMRSPFGLEEQSIQLSGMRQTIAKRLVESKTTIPHYQVTFTFAMDELMKLRKELNQSLAEQDVKLSVNDFLVRACALSMYEHPYFNSSFAKDRIDVHGQVNVGIAISIPVERGGGLVVATIYDADRKTLREISYESKYRADKARTRGLAQEEITGSTFTISNLGMFGVDNFTAIINPPNVAILAVGAALQKPVVRDGELAVGYEMSGTLSCDHRVIDGAMAAQYLNTLRNYLEKPATLLV